MLIAIFIVRKVDARTTTKGCNWIYVLTLKIQKVEALMEILVLTTDSRSL